VAGYVYQDMRQDLGKKHINLKVDGFLTYYNLESSVFGLLAALDLTAYYAMKSAFIL
jgi:hypothetical protein